MTRLFFAALAGTLLLAAPARAVPAVQLRLAGTTTGGVSVADEAAYVRLLPDAQTGYDANDATKLFPLASQYALLAPVGERFGAPYRLAVNSLPDGSPGVLTAPVVVPVDFYTTHAGSFTVRWNGPAALPAGWNAYLRDYTTGAVVNLRQQTVYAFTSAALPDWVSRFQLVLTPAGVAAQLDVADQPGWRLLSVPVAGVTVDVLARLNLVQGVAAGVPAATFPAQYPDAGSNLYTRYTGTGYTRAASTGTVLEPGRGFFWFFYDQDIAPLPGQTGGGTSRSRDLRGFVLHAYGTAETANVAREVAPAPDRFVMAGNPFATSFAVSGVTAPGATIETTVQAYDPDSVGTGPTYRPLFQSHPMTGLSDVVAPWQGFFVSFATLPAGTPPTLAYAVAATVPTDAAFYGRGAPDALAVHLTLAGTTAAGAVRDAAAWVRLRDGAAVGRDRNDADKLTPPGDGPAALLAPVGPGGERQSVAALPVASASVPVAFSTTAAGTFELRWDERRVPDGWTATLRDLATGAVTDLAEAEAYAFASDATDWTERFELNLSEAAVAAEPAADAAFALSAPVPNPATGIARLRVTAARSGRVVATVVDALGRTVAVAFDAEVAAGATAEIAVDAARLAPGTYAVRVATAGASQSRRLVVVR